ncbi:MAG: rhodanese-like domain-containing protein [Desulfovibrionaceae bacterium]|nr:rhodanese-like domain-containing protein [Desulfovibrionaceae bacterium]
MHERFTLTACLLLAFALFSPPARADENDVWRASAQAEAASDGYRIIDARTLKERLESGADMLLIDARADYEYAAGHIPGARNMEFDLGDRTDLSAEKKRAFEALAGPNRKRTLVIYCRSFR